MNTAVSFTHRVLPLLVAGVSALTHCAPAPPPSPSASTHDIPAWRGEHPGTAWLGPDVLWRPREWLIFHMQDEVGGGFVLELTVRDMNIYLQGERPAQITVVGPRDRILARHEVADDGITSGGVGARDGIYDTFGDFRYREWHRVHSPGGRPPGKMRSDLLAAPETLPARSVRIDVPDGGPGLYRVVVTASWDHWISITPDRPIPTGVHPGPGPLALHDDRLVDGAYVWIPSTTKHLNVSVSEEVQPFRARLAMHDETGRLRARRDARTFQTYVVDTDPVHDSVYRLSVENAGPGACLHIRGVPPVLAPDAETARLIHGGITVDAQGRHTFHHHQRLLDRWADAVPASARQDTHVAAIVDGLSALRRLAPFYWYDTRDVDLTYRFNATSPFTPAHRSGWYSLGLDSRQALALAPAMTSGAVPDSVVDAWKTSLRLWAVAGHSLMHVGETSNQWTYNMSQMLQVWQATGEPVVRDIIERDMRRLTTTGSLGSLDPDGPPGHIDLGRSPAGFMAEQSGWDGQYGQEQEHNLGRAWLEIPVDAAVDWWRELYWLKAHLTLPKRGVPTTVAFTETVSPTDINFRTRYYTHKTGLPAQVVDDVPFGELWRDDGVPKRGWPALADSSFARSVIDQFHFVRTATYYATAYSGPRLPSWNHFRPAVVDSMTGEQDIGAGGHMRLAGYGGPGYGGFGRKAPKVGALSAVHVDGVGPILLGSNHQVADAHVVWGRRHTPVSEVWDEASVDPTIVSSGYAQPDAQFDAQARTYRLREALEFAPLVVERHLTFEEDRIVVDLTLTATDSLDLAELYLAFPFVTDDRVLRSYGADLQESGVVEIPPATLKATRSPRWEIEAQRFDVPRVQARAVEIANAEGQGMTILLPESVDWLHASPFRYREIASNQGSLSVPLPTRMAPGERFEMRYVLLVHGESVSPAVLRAAWDESGK